MLLNASVPDSSAFDLKKRLCCIAEATTHRAPTKATTSLILKLRNEYDKQRASLPTMGVLHALYRFHTAQESSPSTFTLWQSIKSGSPLHYFPDWALITIAFGCLVMAACVAGLSIGYMSLDTVGLEIISNSTDRTQAEAARRILPLREHGNLLLVTLLLVNTLVTELLPLVLDELYPGGYFALLASVVSIVLFGEIIPQAVCSRHPLIIGAYMVNFVKVVRFILWPVAAPIAFLLDSFLGEELGTVYSRDQLKGLIDVHSKDRYGVLTEDETMILKGTLDFSQKTVAEIMTKADDVFMLDIDTVLDRKTLKSMMKAGHSRIPLYTGTRGNVVALLLVKQLLLVDPQQNIIIRALINKKKRAHKIRVSPPIYCSRSTLLPDLLNEFQVGRSHMAIVYNDINKPDKEQEFLGIVTLEDIIEEVIMEEIQDETDVYQDNRDKKPTYVRGLDGRLMRANSALIKRSVVRASRTLKLRDIDVKALTQPLLGEKSRNPDYGPDESMSSLYGDECFTVTPGTPVPKTSPRLLTSSTRRAKAAAASEEIGGNNPNSSPTGRSVSRRCSSISRVEEDEMFSNLDPPNDKQRFGLEKFREVTREKPPRNPDASPKTWRPESSAQPMKNTPGENTPLLDPKKSEYITENSKP